MHKIRFYGLFLALLLTILLPSVTIAAYSTQDYTPKDSNVNSDINHPLKPSEIVELYPMSAEEEAAIVHVIPECPVIVDGVIYKGKDISLFDGQRLHFTTDKEGSLYAFTDAVKMEEFIEKEYGNIFELSTTSSKSSSLLYVDWWYGEPKLNCLPGQQFLELAPEWNNCISSAEIRADVPVTLWDYEGLTGDSYTMFPGIDYPILALHGFNDRASSIS